MVKKEKQIDKKSTLNTILKTRIPPKKLVDISAFRCADVELVDLVPHVSTQLVESR